MPRRCLLVLLIVIGSALIASGQSRRGGFDPADRLRALDRNNDGKLEDEEIPARFRPFLMRRFEEAGLDTSRPIDIDAYLEGRSDEDDRRGNDDREDGDRRDGDRDRKNDKADDDRLVPGFGVDTDLPTVLGFGIDSVEADSGIRAGGVPLEDRYHERILRYVSVILRRYDRDDNDTLDREEWRQGRWRDPPPEASDLDGDGRLTREELCQRVSNYDEFDGLQRSSGGTSSSSRSSDSDGHDYDRHARALMRRYDENDNGVLEEDEWKKMSRYNQGADRNDDDIITREEIARHLASYASASRGYGGSRSSSSERSSGGRPGNSYRVTGEGGPIATDVERLPEGLPDWFTRNDANADGQISMAEFSVSWSREKIAEFRQYDANSDGLITPAECMANEESSGRSRYSRSRRR